MATGKTSRTKGASFERAMAALFRQVFPDARRGLQFRDQRECDLEGTPIRFELKCYKNWPSVVKALEQCRADADKFDDERPRAVLVKRNFSEPYVVFHVLDFLKFCEENLYSPTHDNVIEGPWAEESTNDE